MSTMASAVAVLKEATHGPNFKSRTGSSRGYYKRNGELIAVPHPVPMSSAEMTARSAARGALTSTNKDSYRDPNLKAALETAEKTSAIEPLKLIARTREAWLVREALPAWIWDEPHEAAVETRGPPVTTA